MKKVELAPWQVEEMDEINHRSSNRQPINNTTVRRDSRADWDIQDLNNSFTSGNERRAVHSGTRNAMRNVFAA